MYNLGGDGFYIEACVRGTVLQWNTVYDSGSGIGFRQNWANIAFENYFFHNSGASASASCDVRLPVKADCVMYNWLIDNGMGSSFGPNLSKEPAQIFDHNIYKFQDWPDVDLRVRKPATTKIDPARGRFMTEAKSPHRIRCASRSRSRNPFSITGANITASGARWECAALCFSDTWSVTRSARLPAWLAARGLGKMTSENK